MAEKKRVHVFVSGRVQGVYFRDSARTEALKNGVTGWIQNLPDGRVEAVFEGNAVAVDRLVVWCHSGPPGAFVTLVETQPGSFTGEYPNFVVRRGYS